MPELIAVRFTRQYGSYNAAEVATFPESQAKKLIACGLVRAVEPVTTAESISAEITHIGGAWYEVNGERVKGKKAAETLAAEKGDHSG